MKRPPLPKPQAATVIVAASDSLHPEQADYVCSGVNDHLAIQAALDALPATGGEVKLLEGTYNCEVQIDLDSNQTLRGCGRNTILTTSTVDLIFLSAVGGAGTEKTGIVIADLQIDGGAGAVSDCGIYFEYVDYSLIQNVYSRRHTSGTGSFLSGIYLLNSDFNQIVNNACQGNGLIGIWLVTSSNNTINGNTCQGNSSDGIYLDASSNNTISGNTCQGNGGQGIYLDASSNNTITGNTCQGNNNLGIYLSVSSNNTISGNTCQGNNNGGILLIASSNNNTITGNTCQGNSNIGIWLEASSNNNTITGNTCIKNSQTVDDTFDNIYLIGSSYNLILGNLCRAPTVGTLLTAGEPLGETDIQVNDTIDFVVGDGVVLDLGGANEEYHRISAITAGAPGIITIPAPGLTFVQGIGATIDVPEAQYGINISNAPSTENVVKENDLYGSGKTGNLNDAGTNSVVRENRGYATESRGTATILAAQTTIAVNHLLDKTPVAGDIIVTPAESLGLASEFWIDTYTPAQFTINVDIAPGADTDFVWQARVL